jgi:hypothetical protein
MDWCLYSSFVHAFNYLGGKGWAAGAALPAVSACPAQRRPPARQQGCGPPTPTTSPVLIYVRRGGSHDSPPQAQRENSGRKNALSPCTELELTKQMGSFCKKKCVTCSQSNWFFEPELSIKWNSKQMSFK